MTNLYSRLLTLFMCFVLVVLAPYMISVTVDDYTARVEALKEVETFVDTVCDTHVLSKAQIDDLNMGIAESGVIASVKVTYYTEVINPAASDGKINYSLVYQDEILSEDLTDSKIFDSGDHIVVEVKSLGYTGSQRIARSVLGAVFSKMNIRIPGRVR